jgi:hypothetical protein
MANCRTGDDKGRTGDDKCDAGAAPRAIAHIRFPLSGIVAGGQLSFLEARPIR